MVVRRTATFKKQYKKLPTKIQLQFDQRFKLFVVNSRHPQLRTHPLKGRYSGYWSMDVTGDVRALYRMIGNEVIILGFIGTHSQLYG